MNGISLRLVECSTTSPFVEVQSLFWIYSNLCFRMERDEERDQALTCGLPS